MLQRIFALRPPAPVRRAKGIAALKPRGDGVQVTQRMAAPSLPNICYEREREGKAASVGATFTKVRLENGVFLRYFAYISNAFYHYRGVFLIFVRVFAKSFWLRSMLFTRSLILPYRAHVSSCFIVLLENSDYQSTFSQIGFL